MLPVHLVQIQILVDRLPQPLHTLREVEASFLLASASLLRESLRALGDYSLVIRGDDETTRCLTITRHGDVYVFASLANSISTGDM